MHAALPPFEEDATGTGGFKFLLQTDRFLARMNENQPLNGALLCTPLPPRGMEFDLGQCLPREMFPPGTLPWQYFTGACPVKYTK